MRLGKKKSENILSLLRSILERLDRIEKAVEQERKPELSPPKISDVDSPLDYEAAIT